MSKCTSSGIAVFALSFCSIAAGAQEPPKVKIPEAGVPQIMTLEGRYVRVAYNNEGYVILGYKAANLSVGEEWMLLEVGFALREHVPDYVLSREAVSLELPDGKTIPLATNKEYLEANLSALQRRAKVQRDPINYFPNNAVRACRVGFFAEPDQRAMPWGDVELSDGRSLRAAFLVGCDGGRSLIRKSAGIEFPGWDPTVCSLIAEAEMREEPELGIRHDEHGTQAIGRLEDGRVGLVVSEPWVGQTEEPTLRDLSEALVAVWGTDFGVHSPTWISRFTDMTRQAASYREGRVLLAGDAAHVHYPVGGQGLNMALRDAVVAANRLGPALAAGASPAEIDAATARVEEERLPETVAIQTRQERVPPILFGSRWRSRLLIDVLAPMLVRTGLLQRIFARNLRFFARGVSEVRYGR